MSTLLGKMETSVLRKLFVSLRAIQLYPERRGPCGICLAVKLSLDDSEDWWEALDVMERIWEKWPKYSGDSFYPIPGSVFKSFSWNPETELGKLRLELLSYLIAQIQQELSKRDNEVVPPPDWEQKAEQLDMFMFKSFNKGMEK